MEAYKIISGAILGVDFESVFVGGRVYHIHPPTIRRFVGAMHSIGEVKGDSLAELVKSLDMDGAAKALSWLIQGDESLYDTFREARVDEVVEALIIGLSLIGAENFIKLSALLRNVTSLIARPK